MQTGVDNTTDFPNDHDLSVSQQKELTSATEKTETPVIVPQSEVAKFEIGFFPEDSWINKISKNQFQHVSTHFRESKINVPETLFARVDYWDEEEEDEEEAVSDRCQDLMQDVKENAKLWKQHLEFSRQEYDKKAYAEDQLEEFWLDIQKKFRDEVQRIIQKKSCRSIQ